MKKKILSILLVIVLMMSMLIGLTACGDEEDESESKSKKESKVSTSDEVKEDVDKFDVEEFAEEIVDLVNDVDFDEIVDDYLDKDAFIAYMMIYGLQKDGINEIKFDEMYQFVQDAQTKSASKVVKDHKDIMNILNGDEDYSKSELEEQIENFKEMLESDMFTETYIDSIKEEFEWVPTTISLDKVGKLKKVKNTENLYEVDIKATIKSKYSTQSGKTTFYLIEDDGDYKIASADVLLWALFDDNGVLTKAENSSENTKLAQAKESIEIAINDINSEFVSNVWSNNVTIHISDYLTYEVLDTELRTNGYKICTAYSTTAKPTSMNSSAIGDCYFTSTSGNESTIYKAEIKESSTFLMVTISDVTVEK